MKYILVGNPNVGKTTFFNLMTDSNHKVTNFAGTTVDVVERNIKKSDDIITDIPGIRGLSHDSEDEYIAIKTIIDNDFDCILNIIDGMNLKRNLYLTIQLLETGRPIHFIVNLADELSVRGIEIKEDSFAQAFGVVQVISAKNTKDATAIIAGIRKTNSKPFRLNYGQTIEKYLIAAQDYLKSQAILPEINQRFLAIQLCCGNSFLDDLLTKEQQKKLKIMHEKLEAEVIEKGLALSVSGLFFKVRRKYITDALDKSLTRDTEIADGDLPQNTNWIDAFLLNKYIGIPIFLLLFYLVFYLTFLIGDPLTAFLEGSILAPLGGIMRSGLVVTRLPEMGISLLIDGGYAGFSTVVMFLPQIILVFIFLSVLEGSGYMSRAIILFDRLFSKIGLNGKALAPMMIGMGCNVPAIMAARTIADKRERMITQLIIPFISCAARLEIYILFIGLFFEKNQAIILLGLNVLGFIVALISAKIFSLSFFKKQEQFFLVEIPPYRSVNLVYISKMTLNKVSQFIQNAGKFIVIGSIAIWVLLSFGFTGYTTDIDTSFFAYIGHLFAWAFIPLGFGTWQATSSLITGFLAKELVVAQMGVLLADFPSVESGIATLFTPAGSVSFMVFNLLYIPCLSTVAVLKQELKSWKWIIFSIVYSFVVAYVIAWITYQIASIFL
ncbi:ferrous iron transporter protein B and GTP-binding protein [Erysipelotrichaceae bacterium]|nr:ferrous iron transporter protein B and GTP-binding protein [Erysipelotrichaceae bacterium]